MLKYFVVIFLWNSFIHWWFCALCFIIFPLQLLSYLALSLTTQLCFLLLLLLFFFLSSYPSSSFKTTHQTQLVLLIYSKMCGLINSIVATLQTWSFSSQTISQHGGKRWSHVSLAKALIAIDWWPLGGRINFSLMAWTPVCPPCIHIIENLSCICLQENQSKQLICIWFAFYVHT